MNITIDDRIQLPPIRTQATVPSSMSFYGANQVLGTYCGNTKPGHCFGFGWQHGWCLDEYHAIDPILVVQEPVIDRSKFYLVARQTEAACLQAHGLLALAIGMPFVYAKSLPVQRIPNSLLVMPAHSLEYTSHQWKFDDYADQINDLRGKFETIVACIHPSCIGKNYWVPQFEKIGVPWITGADVFDTNGLVRVKTLMNQFEFMTTNSFGSHLVYASASGVKVSIFGEYARYRAADFERAELYQLNPQILEPKLRMISEDFVRQKFPDWFCPPNLATENRDWALSQLGAENRLPVSEIKPIFGWDSQTRLTQQAKSLSRQLMRGPERWVKSLVGR